MVSKRSPVLQAVKSSGLRREHSISVLPRHVAIVMDGNGRWAAQRDLPRHEGHRTGTENISRIVQVFARYKVPYLTLYAFSTENWMRPDHEVRSLMTILEQIIDRQVVALHRKGVRLRHLGRLDRMSVRLRDAIARATALTCKNKGLTLSVAFDYGSREEILQAVRRLLLEGTSPEQLDEDHFNRYLYTAELPEPDLVIRTGGEIRLSNFLLWQSAYSEYYHTPVLWPDFGERDVKRSLLAYQQRQRRFGTLQPNGYSAG